MPLTKDQHAFYRVITDYAVQGTSRTSWEMRRDFIDPQPWSFQLQANKGAGEPSEWVNVGVPVVNSFYALDSEKRQYGKVLRVVYRVVLTTPNGVYTSNNAQVFGSLTFHQWLIARAIIRRALLFPKSMKRLPGYLLKRKLYGTVCSCVDPYTGGITNSDHALCQGTGRITGYWQAVENTMFDFTPDTNKEERDPQLMRGTVNENMHIGKFVGLPQIMTEDVWVDKDSDQRYYIGEVKHLAELEGVPLVVQAELRLAPMTDIIYSLELSGS